MSKVFLQRGDRYSITDDNFTLNSNLQKGIYDLRFDENTMSFYLEKINDCFHFGYKLYGLDHNLIDHVLNTYKKSPTKKNIGVLLNGTKGTGKTVTAKYLANELGLPVITISHRYSGLAEYISSIKQDVIFFFDEFEKNFGGREDIDGEMTGGEELLSVMDGVSNTGCSHIFLLTTNTLRINENFLSRPSRIRYIKTFESVMSKDLLEEIINDFLEDKSKKEELIEYVNTLEIATIDIVKSIIEEMNIHNCSVNDFKKIFNVSIASYMYCYHYTQVYEGDDEGDYNLDDFKKDCINPHNQDNKRRIYYNTYTSDVKFADLTVGKTFRGEPIKYINAEEKIIVTHSLYNGRTVYYNISTVVQEKLYNDTFGY